MAVVPWHPVFRVPSRAEKSLLAPNLGSGGYSSKEYEQFLNKYASPLNRDRAFSATSAEEDRAALQAEAVAEEADEKKAAESCPLETPSNEPSQLARGKRAHQQEPIRPSEEAEVRTPSGKRMDRYDAEKAHIREIKPDNKRAIRAGEKQVEGYKREMEKATGRPHTTEVTPYDPSKY